jgi:hypothetical protein
MAGEFLSVTKGKVEKDVPPIRPIQPIKPIRPIQPYQDNATHRSDEDWAKLIEGISAYLNILSYLKTD